MRLLIVGSLAIAGAVLIGGCGASSGAKSDMPAATHGQAAADATACTVQSGRSAVLRMTMPAQSTCVNKDGFTKVTAPHFELDVWVVDGAQSIDDAVGRVSKQMVSEFKDFAPDHTTDLTIAGQPAKRLAGHGHEADDGDNGDADVIVFKVGGHFFIACTHDESLTPDARQGMLTMVQTAEAP